MDDVDVIDRGMLDGEYAKKFTKPWLVQFADGEIIQFDTEEDACAYQREWRSKNGMNSLTGEAA